MNQWFSTLSGSISKHSGQRKDNTIHADCINLIKKLLIEDNVCPRCILRIFGCVSWESYLTVPCMSDILHTLGNGTAAKRPASSVSSEVELESNKRQCTSDNKAPEGRPAEIKTLPPLSDTIAIKSEEGVQQPDDSSADKQPRNHVEAGAFEKRTGSTAINITATETGVQSSAMADGDITLETCQETNDNASKQQQQQQEQQQQGHLSTCGNGTHSVKSEPLAPEHPKAASEGGTTTVGIYQEAAHELDEPMQQSSSSTVCSLCLGVLQCLDPPTAGNATLTLPCHTQPSATPLSFLDPQTIATTVQTATGTSTSSAPLRINLEVTHLPMAALIREKTLVNHLSGPGRGPNSSINPRAVVSVASAIRSVLGPRIAELLGATLVPQSADVTLRICAYHAASNQELLFLGQDQVKMEERRRNRQGRHRDKPQKNSQPAASKVFADEQDLNGEACDDAVRPTETGEALEACTSGKEPVVDPVQRALDDLIQLDLSNAQQRITSLPHYVFSAGYKWPPQHKYLDRSGVALTLIRAPLLLAGRYLKLHRGIPQSKWIDSNTGQRIGDSSVEERIEAVLTDHYHHDKMRFIAGGREDADVRMLGTGRPFVVELVNPKASHPSPEQLRELEQKLELEGSGVVVRQLTPCNASVLEALKQAEESKEKSYEALCWSELPMLPERVQSLLALKDITIQQDTPVRVLHRRSAQVRARRVTVESVEVVPERPHYFKLRVRTQAGTYIKEFVHGDFGRTQPSVGSVLACRAEIMQLDVCEVHMADWP